MQMKAGTGKQSQLRGQCAGWWEVLRNDQKAEGRPCRGLLIATGEAIPLRGLEGVPGLPGAPQDEAGLTRKFETSHVGGPNLLAY